MRADAAIVVNSNVLPNVSVSPIRNAVRMCLTLEADLRVRAVAKRLVLGTATPAKGKRFRFVRRNRVTVRVSELR